MKLLSNHCLVERVKRKTALTTGGILLPDVCIDDFNTGGPKEFIVLGVGPGRRNRNGDTVPVEFVPGDRVICHSYTTGTHPLPDGTMVITDDMVIAVIPKHD
mgnify:CR=1 FL=1